MWKNRQFCWTSNPVTYISGTTCTSLQNPTSDSCTAISVEANKWIYTASGCFDEEKDKKDSTSSNERDSSNSSFNWIFS